MAYDATAGLEASRECVVNHGDGVRVAPDATDAAPPPPPPPPATARSCLLDQVSDYS